MLKLYELKGFYRDHPAEREVEPLYLEPIRRTSLGYALRHTHDPAWSLAARDLTALIAEVERLRVIGKAT
jgi:hypothetical protein